MAEVGLKVPKQRLRTKRKNLLTEDMKKMRESERNQAKNKSKVYIGDQIKRWASLKQQMNLKTNKNTANFLIDWYYNHLPNSSENYSTGTCSDSGTTTESFSTQQSVPDRSFAVHSQQQSVIVDHSEPRRDIIPESMPFLSAPLHLAQNVVPQTNDTQQKNKETSIIPLNICCVKCYTSLFMFCAKCKTIVRQEDSRSVSISASDVTSVPDAGDVNIKQEPIEEDQKPDCQGDIRNKCEAPDFLVAKGEMTVAECKKTSEQWEYCTEVNTITSIMNPEIKQETDFCCSAALVSSYCEANKTSQSVSIVHQRLGTENQPVSGMEADDSTGNNWSVEEKDSQDKQHLGNNGSQEFVHQHAKPDVILNNAYNCHICMAVFNKIGQLQTHLNHHHRPTLK